MFLTAEQVECFFLRFARRCSPLLPLLLSSSCFPIFLRTRVQGKGFNKMEWHVTSGRLHAFHARLLSGRKEVEIASLTGNARSMVAAASPAHREREKEERRKQTICEWSLAACASLLLLLMIFFSFFLASPEHNWHDVINDHLIFIIPQNEELSSFGQPARRRKKRRICMWE